MKTPWGAMLGVWLATWPAWGGALLPPVSPFASTEAPAAVRGAIPDTPASLLSLSNGELARRVEADVTSLGSLSIGAPGSAILLNAVVLSPGPHWEIAQTADVWGTSETMASIETALDRVHELFPSAPPIVVGDISDSDGGRLKRHESHQGGRDVDLGFYYKAGQQLRFTPGTAANLDLPRNWGLVRALVTCTDVETILLDTRIQRALYTYALSISEDKDWLDRVFQYSRGSGSAVIKHVPGHRNHYHVRFYNPVAQELGRRAHPYLVQVGLVDPPVFTVRHVVRQGQTMGHLAARYGTSVRAIKQANGLTTTQLRAGRSYRIPVRAAAPPSTPVVVPPRLLPPSTPAELAFVAWPTPLSLYADRFEMLMENPALFTRLLHVF
jgi:penicillin-insensitive murein endopeptidase